MLVIAVQAAGDGDAALTALLVAAGAVAGVVVGLLPALVVGLLLGVIPRRRTPRAADLLVDPASVPVRAATMPAPPAAPVARSPATPPPPAAPTRARLTVSERHKALYDAQYAAELRRLRDRREAIGAELAGPGPRPPDGGATSP